MMSKEAHEKARSDKPAEGQRKASFQEFVMLLSSQALIHLGSVPEPVSGKKKINLPAAKQTIDILDMLEGKTQGNLNPEESQALSNVLYNLRMRYVEAVEQE
jgi:hypothetical protein